jgi:hypothetical protein
MRILGHSTGSPGRRRSRSGGGRAGASRRQFVVSMRDPDPSSFDVSFGPAEPGGAGRPRVMMGRPASAGASRPRVGVPGPDAAVAPMRSVCPLPVGLSMIARGCRLLSDVADFAPTDNTSSSFFGPATRRLARRPRGGSYPKGRFAWRPTDRMASTGVEAPGRIALVAASRTDYVSETLHRDELHVRGLTGADLGAISLHTVQAAPT